MPKIYVKNREKLILCGLYLAKFDKLGLERLGFSSFLEAYNVLAYALDGKASNVKNYRDEFDPFFPNPRTGWKDRAMRAHCEEIFKAFKDLNLDEFSDIIFGFLVKNYTLQKEISRLITDKKDKGYLQRIATGKAGEGYFKQNYKRHFGDFHLTDTRELGCGFDFKLENDRQFFCVEVKGLCENKGSFLLSEKEHKVASNLKEKYCLFIVKNLKEKPNELLFFDPILKLNLTQIEQKSYSYRGLV